MFGENEVVVNLSAKFVSLESFRSGFVTSANLPNPDSHEMDNTLTEENFVTDKLIRPCSINGNTNNWNTSKTPNSILVAASTSSLDHFFSPLLCSHPMPPKVSTDDLRKLEERRSAFYAGMQACRHAGMQNWRKSKNMERQLTAGRVFIWKPSQCRQSQVPNDCVLGHQLQLFLLEDCHRRPNANLR